jgi:hypothetical protein
MTDDNKDKNLIHVLSMLCDEVRHSTPMSSLPGSPDEEVIYNKVVKVFFASIGVTRDTEVNNTINHRTLVLVGCCLYLQ